MEGKSLTRLPIGGNSRALIWVLAVSDTSITNYVTLFSSSRGHCPISREMQTTLESLPVLLSEHHPTPMWSLTSSSKPFMLNLGKLNFLSIDDSRIFCDLQDTGDIADIYFSICSSTECGKGSGYCLHLCKK